MNISFQFEDFNKSLSELYPDLHSQPTPSEACSGDLEFYECPFPGCGKVYRYKSEKERHLVTHNKDKAYKCDHPYCTKSFKRPDALKVHMQSHSEKPQWICPVSACSHAFKDRPALKYHLSKHHAEELKIMGNSLEFQQALSNKKAPRQRQSRRKAQAQQNQEIIGQQATHFIEEASVENNEDYAQRIYSLSPSEERGFWEEDLISPEPRKILCTEGEKREVYLLDNLSTCSSESQKGKSPTDEMITDDINQLKSAYSKLARENEELKKELVNKLITFTERKIDIHSVKDFNY